MTRNSIRFTKECRICKKQIGDDGFAYNPFSPDGLTEYCKRCGAVDIVDSISMYLQTPDICFELAAAAFVNKDIEGVQYVFGQLKEINPDYICAIREMAKQLIAALEAL